MIDGGQGTHQLEDKDGAVEHKEAEGGEEEAHHGAGLEGCKGEREKGNVSRRGHAQ